MTLICKFVSRKNQGDKVIVFDRGGLLWVFNFHPVQSFADYRIGTDLKGPLKAVLCSDGADFMGHARIDLSVEYHTHDEVWDDRANWLQVYIPCRTALVLAPK